MFLKERIARGDRLNGCFVMLASASVVELIGYSGFDFAIIDQEHGSIDPQTAENQIRAADAAGIEAIVRVPGPDQRWIQHVLDAGASGIMVPHIVSAAAAQTVVHAAHYPPLGARGFAGTTRAGFHGTAGGAISHLERASGRTIVIAMIEDRDGVDRASEIAGTRGIDAIFIGPMDLAMSLGHPGDPDHPDVAAAIRQTAADAKAAGAQVMTFVGSVDRAAKVRDEMEIRSVCFSSSQLFAKTMLDTIRDARKQNI